MNTHIIFTGTVTYASKAKELLQRKGFKANIKRITGSKNTGCGYAVVVTGDINEAERILRENHIKILSIERGN